MQQDIVRDVREILPLLEEVETAIAGLYRACAERFEDDAEFWRQLMREEEQHAAYIRRGAEVIAQEPERYRVGREFNARAVGEFVQGVREARRAVEAGSAGKRQALLIAYEIEESYIEKRFSDTVYARDPALLSLFRQIARETAAHQKLLREKLDNLPDTTPG